MGLVNSLFRAIWGSSEDESIIDPITGLSLLQKRLIVESWRALGSKKEQRKFGVEFFIQLFETYPEQKDMFPAFRGNRLRDLEISPVMRAHATTVMTQIGAFVQNLDDPECLMGLLDKVAQNHVARSVGVSPFEDLRKMFGSYLENQLGTQATPEVKESWDKLLEILNNAIRERENKVNKP